MSQGGADDRQTTIKKIRNTVRAIVIIRYISQCDNAVLRYCDGDSAIVRWRQRDGENAIVRWRHCDIVLSRYRIVIIALSHYRHRIVALSSSHLRTIALSTSEL